MFCSLYFLLCCVVLSCNAYIRCDDPPDKRSAYSTVQKWPANTVPYEITDVFSAEQKKLIRDSLQEVTDKTSSCVKFVERTSSHPAWVRVISQNGCWSMVGKTVQTGAQDLSLDINGCIWKQTVMHEFLHALGFVHEQTRPDRDSYVKVLYENVQTNMKHNFEKNPQGALQSFGLPYDFNSVMHYRYDGFSINCLATMEPAQATSKPWRYTMGKATQLSTDDIYKIKKIYGCV